MNSPPRQQRGVALLVALLVVALAVILIAALLDRGELALARTRNSLRLEQAQAYAQGLEVYAVEVLIATRNTVDTNASPWAQPMPPQPVPGGVIGATMRDLNGCFNLNNLAGSSSSSSMWLPIFQRLLTARGVDPSLAGAVNQWLGSTPSSGDENYYLAQPVPYRPAQRKFSHVSELRLVRGFDSDVYARVAPDLCALPFETNININTASVAVLQSLSVGMTQAIAEGLWQNGHAQYQVVEDFVQAANVLGLPSGSLDTHSKYFLARGDIQLDGVPFTFNSLIQEDDNGGFHVIQRSRGSDDALTTAVVIDPESSHDGLN